MSSELKEPPGGIVSVCKQTGLSAQLPQPKASLLYRRLSTVCQECHVCERTVISGITFCEFSIIKNSIVLYYGNQHFNISPQVVETLIMFKVFSVCVFVSL